MEILTIVQALVGCWLIMAVMMAAGWLVQQRTGNSGWVDVVWTMALGLSGIIGATAAFAGDQTTARQYLVAGLVFIWAFRLVGHIAFRSANISDDPRYVKLREEWGDAAGSKMFGFLQMQALASLPMLLAIILAAWNPRPLFGVMDIIALATFAAAITGSYLSDRQLTRFKHMPNTSGKVCDIGLWSWSRHPNYFFEILIWLSISLFALNFTGDWQVGYVALLGPLCMYWLLRFVSGVPPLEEHMVSKYGDAYRAYQDRTSVLIPLPPSQ